MRQFIIVGIIDPPSISTIEPPVSVEAIVSDAPSFFIGKVMAIINQVQATGQFYVLRPSPVGFIIDGKYHKYSLAFEYAIQHLLPLTNNFTMPSSDSYDSY